MKIKSLGRTSRWRAAILAVLLASGFAPVGVMSAVHDLANDFSLDANPTATGWQYSESVANGGGPVGPAVTDWNAPDFGPGQSGWQGAKVGAHAGWAKRIDNGSETATFDDPIDTVITHGFTSVLWKSPAGDTDRFASISGGVWNIRHLGRKGSWRLYKNDSLLSQGQNDDAAGTSDAPSLFETGSGGEEALKEIAYLPGDSFRLEILEEDFVGIRFTITTTSTPPDPFIQTSPESRIVPGGTPVQLSITASGSAPLTYQWLLNGVVVDGQTAATLSIPSPTELDSGAYSVLVTSPNGSKTSKPGVLYVDAPGTPTPGVHDLATDFTLSANPSDRGWKYAQSLDAEGGVVGPRSFDWIPTVFGPHQPGWLGTPATPFIGWAKRIENGELTGDIDAPPGSIMTHGASSVLWTAPAGESDTFATLSGGIWSVEKNSRAQKYRIWKNDVVLLAEKIVNRGSSDAPNSFDQAATAAELVGIPYQAGDTFRLEIIPLSGPGGSLSGPYGDVQGVHFTVTTSSTGPDPAIATHPLSQKVDEGQNVTFTVTAVGTGPFIYAWFYEGVEIPGETGASLHLPSVSFDRSGSYTVEVRNNNGSRLSLPAALLVTPKADSISGARHDLAADFSLDANPTATGWQYSESLNNGGGVVGGVSANWNQPDFGAGQPGWAGARAGAHAGWAKRIDNGSPTPTYDDPVNSVITHGPTSVKWTAGEDDSGGVADIIGSLWNIRHLNRPSNWRVFKNDTELLTDGRVDDDSGSSSSPLSLANGTGGPEALRRIPYVAGDSFRLEISGVTVSDFVAMNLTIITRQVHDAQGDFSLDSNPTASGWQYSESLGNGGGPVGPVVANWNQPDFGPGQPGWSGAKVGAHAGWAKRVNNGNGTPNLDDPEGSLITHGNTSLLWRAPASGPGGLADLSGGLWNLRHLGRSGTWKLLKNDSVTISEGIINDSTGTALAPGSFSEGSGGPSALRGIRFSPGDTFRLEILEGDFVAVKFSVSTYQAPADPIITRHPEDATVLAGGSITLSARATGTQPISFQWQFKGADLTGKTGPDLTLDNVSFDQQGKYRVVVSNSKGTVMSDEATLTVKAPPPAVQGTRHSLAQSFSLESNPSPSGWQYSESLGNGGGPVGPVVANWNQPDFGAGQPGWVGARVGAHAGWAQRIDNGNPTATYDDPVGSVLTHGFTSVLWRAPVGDRGGVADLIGGLWNIRHFGRTGTWKLWHNDSVLLTEGTLDDAAGTSSAPKSFDTGSGGELALRSIPYAPGDTFRLEVLQNDFVGVDFSIITRQVHDVIADFSAEANPTASGWQYSESVGNGGGPVGAFVPNWNQPDFGAGQPGWVGGRAGAHAGWAKRIDNGNPTSTYDDPVDSLLTHGPTSLLWTAPAEDPGGVASLGGGLWNIRHFGRSGVWRLWMNDAQLLSEGTITDAVGTSLAPMGLDTGSGGLASLIEIPYGPGDSFRLEILQGDFVSVQFSITTFEAPPPTRLSIELTDSGAALTWQGSATLQESADIDGPWTDVANATTPHAVTIDSAQKFYRLRPR